MKKAFISKRLFGFLGFIERVGNALPHPALLFVLLTGGVLIGSAILSAIGLSATHPITGKLMNSVNLLSVGGLHFVLTDMVKNFTGFAPLGTVLVAILGFGLAEKSGLLTALLRSIVLKAPRPLIIPAVLLAGVLSHTAGDIGYVLLIPLSALIVSQVGIHPLAGLAASFAGVSGGFAANFLLSTADPMLSGISQEAARIIDSTYLVSPVSNWYFMASSSILIVGLGTLITNKIVIPFLGPYKGGQVLEKVERLSSKDRQGLVGAGLVLMAIIAIILWGAIPTDGFLRDPKSGDLLHSPLLKGVVPIIFLIGALTGLVFGFITKRFKNQNDVVNAMQEVMATMAPYLVLVFFASQFISLFNFSNVGLIFAVHGSEFLRETGIPPIPLILLFILLTCLLDLVIGSASAKWALMAPIFV